MKENHEIERNNINTDATLHMFQCPVCGGHQLSVVFEIYGLRDIVGVSPDESVLFGELDQQGVNYGTCHCGDCDWEGEFYLGEDAQGSFRKHLVVTRSLRFTCPKCGGHELRQLRQGHTTSYLVSAVYQDLSDNAEKVAVNELDREDQGGSFSTVVDAATPLSQTRRMLP